MMVNACDKAPANHLESMLIDLLSWICHNLYKILIRKTNFTINITVLIRTLKLTKFLKLLGRLSLDKSCS